MVKLSRVLAACGVVLLLGVPLGIGHAARLASTAGLLFPPPQVFQFTDLGSYNGTPSHTKTAGVLRYAYALRPDGFLGNVSSLYFVRVYPTGAAAVAETQTEQRLILKAMAPLGETQITYGGTELAPAMLHAWAVYTPTSRCNAVAGLVYRNISFMMFLSSQDTQDDCDQTLSGKVGWIGQLQMRFLHTTRAYARSLVGH